MAFLRRRKVYSTTVQLPQTIDHPSSHKTKKRRGLYPKTKWPPPLTDESFPGPTETRAEQSLKTGRRFGQQGHSSTAIVWQFTIHVPAQEDKPLSEMALDFQRKNSSKKKPILSLSYTRTRTPPPHAHSTAQKKRVFRSSADRTTSPVTLRSSLFSLSVKQVSKCQHGREPAISVRHDLFGRSVNDCSFSVNLRQRWTHHASVNRSG